MYRTIVQDMRFPLTLMIGGLIAFALFLFMHQLIATHHGAPDEAPVFQTIHTVQVRRQAPVITKTPKRPHPPTAAKQPAVIHHPVPMRNPVARPRLNFPLAPGRPDGPVIDNRAQRTMPAPSENASLGVRVRVSPLYPPRAAAQGIQGSVTTCFKVAPDGSVVGPRVTGASSPQARRLLGQAALRTIRQWEFFPRRIGGRAVATPHVCQDIAFVLH